MFCFKDLLESIHKSYTVSTLHSLSGDSFVRYCEKLSWYDGGTQTAASALLFRNNQAHDNIISIKYFNNFIDNDNYNLKSRVSIRSSKYGCNKSYHNLDNKIKSTQKQHSQ